MYQNAKIHSLISLSGFIRMLVLFGLCGYTSYIVYKGPICSWTRNSTIIRKNEINTDADLQLESDQRITVPSLSVCKYPIYKNAAKYDEFLKRNYLNNFKSESEFNAYVDEVFYTKPEDFFLGFNMASTYQDVVKNVSRIPVSDPYVQIVLIDYIYTGFCAIISYEAIMKYLIEHDEIKNGQQDFSFFNVIILNGRNMEDDGAFLFKYIMKGEDIFAGAETITNTYNGKLGCGMAGTYLLDFELEKFIRNCKEVEIITPCVIKYFEQEYTNDYRTRFNMTTDRALTSFNGINSLFSKTKCFMPCQLTKYDVKEYRTFDLKYFPDVDVKKYLNEFNDSKSSIIFINHQKPKMIVQHEEVLEYDAYDFISDAGGAIGIFVGISFWSIYDDIFGPWIEWFERIFGKKFNN